LRGRGLQFVKRLDRLLIAVLIVFFEIGEQQMKKGLIFLWIGAILCGIFFVGFLAACSFNNRINTKSEFVTLFELEEYKENISLKELYNNYEGAPYEGIALYEVSITAEDTKLLFSEWDSVPFNEETEGFMKSISNYISIPDIKSGRYKMVNRNEEAKELMNVSLFVFDETANMGYYIKVDI
jgi:hypothetical protein